MELVYLWVENYKNIRNQGFNFSPRFECEFFLKYDKDGKLEDNCELRITPKDYVSIFPENINVTAIVGENGSGKSSIVKLILMSIFYKKYKETDNYKDEIKMLEQELKDKSLFLIINTGEGYKKISLNINPINSSLTELDKDAIDFYSIYFSYMLDTLQNKNDYWMWNLYHKSDGYTTPILLTPNKFHKDFLQNSINLDDIEYINIKHSIKFYKKEMTTKINDFFNPNKIKLYSDNPSTIQNVEFDFFGKVGRKYLKLNDKIEEHGSAKYYENLDKKLKEIKELETKKDYKRINLLYIAFKILTSAKSNFQAEIYDNVGKWFNEKLYEDTFLEDGISLIEKNINNIFINDTIKYDNEKINDCLEFHKNTSPQKEEVLNKLLNREILELSNIENISVILVPWLDLELLENEKNFNSLSGGQKLFFTFMVNMMYEVSNLIQEDGYKTINLFLDEVEASYHPNWQKEFIKNISKALKNIDLKDNKINLFFSTHSPFILSDLPKENVIFLEKYDEGNKKELKIKYPRLNLDGLENGNCINVSNHIEIKTFGANIHTLLSNGFFMSDGLMGEFAKNKITKILRFLNDDNKFIDLSRNIKIPFLIPENYLAKNLKSIIKSIGEDFLRKKLLNLYHNKFIKDEKEKEKQILKNKIEELQKQLRELNV